MIDLDRPEEWLLVNSGQLAQVTLTTAETSVLSLASFPGADRIEVEKLHVTNYSNQNRYWSAWHDKNGTTYNNTTVLVNQEVVNANAPKVLDFWVSLEDATGNLSMAAQSNDTFIITIYGKAYKKRT